MPFPQHSKKHREEALFTPRHFFRYLRGLGEVVPRAPSTVILCFTPRLTKFAVEELHFTPASGVPREFILRTPRGPLGLVETQGIGAPALAVTAEELMARGARRLISVGFAAGLQTHLSVGTTVLCTKAVRDEGTSYHYVPAGKYALPSRPLSARLGRRLESQGVRVARGATWTVDAIYRETLAEVRTYRKEGVLTVDMEASALFSIGRAHGVEAAAVFSISDLLEETGWEPRFHEARTHLQELLTRTVIALGGGRPGLR